MYDIIDIRLNNVLEDVIMKIINGFHITVDRSGNLWSNHDNIWKLREASNIQTAHLKAIYRIFRKRNIDEVAKMHFAQRHFDALSLNVSTMHLDDVVDDRDNEEHVVEKPKIKLVPVLQDLINFFSEFSFEPNFRFVNTFARKCVEDVSDATQFVASYFELTDNSYSVEIVDKMKSYEYEKIINNLKQVDVTKKINTRFKLYYGSQGTGKTTIAMEETDNSVMVCHSAMLPSDLMEDFKFEDGKASFKPSALQLAMVNGTKIVLDEINLLPFESLRFLQSLLDGKAQFEYKGETITIKDGFQIIGTMNLVVNGATYALPEPLVDRCEDIVKFKLTAKMLAGAVI